MKFLPLQIRSALGRRMLSQYLCMAMLPVAALAGLFYVQANAALQEARDQELAQARARVRDALKDRLIVAERAVSPLPLPASPNRIRGESDGRRQPTVRSGRAHQRRGAASRCAGKVGELPELDFETRQQLDAGRATDALHEERIRASCCCTGCLPAAESACTSPR